MGWFRDVIARSRQTTHTFKFKCLLRASCDHYDALLPPLAHLYLFVPLKRYTVFESLFAIMRPPPLPPRHVLCWPRHTRMPRHQCRYRPVKLQPNQTSKCSTPLGSFLCSAPAAAPATPPATALTTPPGCIGLTRIALADDGDRGRR